MRKAWGDFPLGDAIFFHLPVRGQQNMFSFFSKGNWNFLIDYSLPKIRLPPAIMLDRARCVSELQNKGPSFVLLKGQPSQPKFSFIGSHRHHRDSPWLSHQSVHTFKVASVFRVHLFQRAGLGNGTQSHSSGKVEGCPEFAETDIRWVL